MKIQVISVFLLIVTCSVRESSGAAEFVYPDSGSVIANFEGPDNTTVLTCNITDQGIQIGTQWSIENFGGNPALQRVVDVVPDVFEIGGDLRPESTTDTFLNRISILNFTSDLDNATLYCGTGVVRRQANFTIRLYRPPNLRDNFLVLLEEDNSQNIPVDLREQPSGFPEPTVFNWMRDGQPFTARPLTYSNVTFDTVNRADAGNYAVTATNFAFGTPAIQIGSDTGSFTLDVLYGPSFQSDGPQQMPTQVYVLLGNPLSLVCGRGLESNPNATVAWTGSDGTPIMDTPRYDLENGPQIVRLNFTNTIMSDNGMWLCEVEVRSRRHVLDSEGNLVLVQPEVIGARLRHQFQLTIISPPGQPRTVSMENVGATWVQITWEPPFVVEFPISSYEIIARASDDVGEIIRNMSTPDNRTFVNVTNLLPGTTYNFTVVAVIQGGDVITRGPESLPLQDISTEFTVPEIVCPMPESRNGNITASWTYVHTGGLPLTGVSVTYTYEEGTSTVSNSVNVGTNDLRFIVPGLVTGREYTFTVTAQNVNGSNSTVCAPVDHIIGVPAPPQFGDLITGPNPGVITVQIKTVASGVNSPDQNFRFNITPVLAGNRQPGRMFDFPMYMSGEFVSILVDQLQSGESYTFSATAMNTFGNSTPANSPQQFAGGDSLPPPSSNPEPPPGDTSNSTAVAVGVAVPVIVLAIVVIIAVLVILFVFLRKNKDHGNYKVEGGKYHKASTSDPGVRVEDATGVDIGTDLEKPPRDTEHEIQYAELDTFRPPSQQKNNSNEAKPVQPEEPVEYAVITTFKKKEEPPPAATESSAVPDPTPEAADANNDADKAGTSTTLV